MRELPTVLVRHDPCAWLPGGGVAEVVRAGSGRAPDPVVLARLLVTSHGSDGPALLVAVRDDGRGLDLPSAGVGDDVDGTVRDLCERALGRHVPTRLLGWVRNTVPADVGGYSWPVPVAHFAVWHCTADREQWRSGRWMGADEAGPVLGDRHWWPLLSTLPGMSRTA